MSFEGLLKKDVKLPIKLKVLYSVARIIFIVILNIQPKNSFKFKIDCQTLISKFEALIQRIERKVSKNPNFQQ